MPSASTNNKNIFSFVVLIICVIIFLSPSCKQSDMDSQPFPKYLALLFNKQKCGESNQNFKIKVP